jgi:Undecaprenyl-phosphate glucose phosphotransferase
LALSLLNGKWCDLYRPELKQAMKPDIKNIEKSTIVDIASLTQAVDREGLRNTVKQKLVESIFVAPRLVAMAVRIGEFLLIFSTAMGCAWRYPGLTDGSNLRTFLIVSLLLASILPICFEIFGLYTLESLLLPARKLAKLTAVWGAVVAAFTISFFLFKMNDSISRIWLFTWATTGYFTFIAVRYFVAHLMRRIDQNGQFNRRAVIVGGGEAASKVIAALRGSKNSGVNLVGIFDDRDDTRATPELEGLFKLGNFGDLIDFVRATRVDTLIITLPIVAEDRLLHLLNRFAVLPVDIRLSAIGQKVRYRPRAYSYIGNLPCLDVFDRPLGDWGHVFKSALDKSLALLAIVLLSPVLLAVALAVKFSSEGPVLFKQKRFGFNNELIEVYKFRSMFVRNADADGTKLVSKNDARVTPIGRFIRRTSLDELPQLINVLKGDLSLVGPRPHPTKAKAGEELYEHVVDHYFARHKVKPGITGWAQINGWRGETDTAEKIERRVEHDLYYIDNWSLTFDLYILARTPLALLNTENAF